MPVAETVEPGFAPVGAEDGKPVELAMQQLCLAGSILPVGARVVVRHVFASAEKKPLEVIYSFMLPRDAALRRFRVTGVGFEVNSELKPVEEATKTYEEGLEQGHLATLARQYRDGVVNLMVGNLRQNDPVTVWLEILAGVELRDDGLRFRFPFTLAPSYHAQARVAQVEPGVGEIELPADRFGDVMLPRFRKSAAGLHEVHFDLTVAMAHEIVELASPSHAVRVTRENPATHRVSLAPAADVPDRDLVLDARSAPSGARVLAGRGDDGRSHFAVVVPSTSFGAAPENPRDVVLLIDRSGSMSGTPMDQARGAAAACLAALGPEDRFGLVAFDNQVETFHTKLTEATPDHRQKARDFLDKLYARGGTELALGVRAAADLLRGSGGDIFILTDGQVFGAEDILATARATGVRLHALGIGSASQDRFLTLLARETGGVSRFVTPRERVDMAAVDLFASASRPIAVGVQVSTAGLAGATVAPDPPGSVFAGTPLPVYGDCDAAASGSMEVRWKTGALTVPMTATDDALGETLRLLRGARLITDVESRLAPGQDAESKRHAERLEKYLDSLSLQYGLASRRMALVAVVERPSDRPGEPPLTRVVPVGLPQDMEMAGVFGPPAAAAPMKLLGATMVGPARYEAAEMALPRYRLGSEVQGMVDQLQDVAQRLFRRRAAEPAKPARTLEDELIELAGRLEPDGGLPGKTDADRVLATLAALLAFLAAGHSALSGALRGHVRRMLKFLDSGVMAGLAPEQQACAKRVTDAVRAAKPLTGQWPPDWRGDWRDLIRRVDRAR